MGASTSAGGAAHAGGVDWTAFDTVETPCAQSSATTPPSSLTGRISRQYDTPGTLLSLAASTVSKCSFGMNHGGEKTRRRLGHREMMASLNGVDFQSSSGAPVLVLCW